MLVLAMSLTMVGCGDKSSSDKKGSDDKKEASVDATDGGKVLNIYCWNTEFQDRVKAYYSDYKDNGDGTGKIGDVTVKWNVVPSDDNAYQNNLDAALQAQANADADDKIDMFLVEADYALKYVDTDYTLDVKGLGITDDELADQYTYTQDIVKSKDGALKGVTWQATPGLFAYRRSIAKDVLGTDDPDKVQEALADWTKFDDVAKKASDKGYKMLSGYDDSYRTFSNNVSKKWLSDDKTIQIDDNIYKWIDQTYEYTQKGYNNKTLLWQPDWQKDQGPKGKVFGFFYSTWGINFTLLGNSLEKAVKDGGKEEVGNGIYGDYAVCQGPQAYYWGGTWMCACAGTDNKSLVVDIMKKLTTDKANMKKITEETQDYTNNKSAMEELANSDFKSAFLGGQNHIKLFAAAAPQIKMDKIGPDDQGLNEGIQTAFHDYFDGKVDKDTALKNFYKAAVEKYPDIKAPSK